MNFIKEKTLLKITTFLIILSLFSLLVVNSKMLFPYISFKAIIFRSICEVALIFYLLLIAKNKQYLPNYKNPLVLAVTIFFTITIFTTITSIDWQKSFYGDIERSEGLFHFIHYYIFFIITISTFKKKKYWESIFLTFVSIMFLMIVYGWFGGYWSKNIYSPNFGTLGHPLYFGTALLFSIIFISHFLISCKKYSLTILKKHLNIFKATLILFLLTSIIALIQTHTRGPIIGLLSGLILATVLFFYYNPSYIKKYKKYLVILATIIILLLSTFYYLRTTTNSTSNNPYVKRFVNISLEDKSIRTRLWTWNTAWQGIKEKPILGWGPENFNIVFNKYFNTNFFEDPSSDTWFSKAHNIILDTLISNGVLGLISYFSIFIILLYLVITKIIKEQKNTLLGIWCISSLLSYFIQNLSGFDTLSSYLCFYLLIGFISFETKSYFNTITKFNSINNIKSSSTLTYLLLIPLFFIIFFMLYWGNYIPYKTNKNIIKPPPTQSVELGNGLCPLTISTFD